MCQGYLIIRILQKRGIKQNHFVAEIADAILILYAAPNSNTERLAYSINNSDKKLYTIKCESNSNLLKLGLENIQISAILETSEV